MRKHPIMRTRRSSRFLLLPRRHFSLQQPTDTVAEEQLESLVQKSETEWSKEEIQSLLSSSSPSQLLQILGRFPDTKTALKFFQLVPPSLIHGPSAYQALFQLASKEPNPHLQMLQLLRQSKQQGFALTTESAALLIRFLGKAGFASESLEIFQSIKPALLKTYIYNDILQVLVSNAYSNPKSYQEALNLLLRGMLSDSSSSTKCRPNGTTCKIYLSALLKRKSGITSLEEDALFGLVSALREQGTACPDSFLFTQLITNLCRSGLANKAWDILHAVKKMGGIVEVPSFNALLTGLGKEHDFRRMNLLLAEMKEMGLKPSVVTFGILINHFCKSHRVDDALQVLENMMIGKFVVRPDVITFNTIIDGLCKVGRQEEGLNLADKMKKQYDCSPNVVTYNCLIDGFCKAGEMDKSSELFARMMEEGVSPNVITINTIIDGMCRHGRISSALTFFNEACGGGEDRNDNAGSLTCLKGNTATYSTLIGAFLRVNNVDKAMELFEEMVRNGCAPDSIMYFTLISGLSQAGRLEEACSVVLAMKRDGFRLDTMSYNVLINGLCKRKKLDKAQEMLKEMEEAGVKADVVTFNTLISALSKEGDLLTAQRVMGNMIEEGFKPSEVTYGALIHGYCKADELDKAMELFGNMGPKGIPPNTVIYTVLIDFLCKRSELDAALGLMDEMLVQGVFPSNATFNALFKGLRERNMLEKAYQLMDQMKKQGCNPDYITMEILTEWLSVVGETPRLRSFVQSWEGPVSYMES